jgi:hypothetical protein
VGFVDKDLEGDELGMYLPLTQGLCMTCRGPLKSQTVFFVTHNGIVAGYCSGPCVQDMAVLGWLQEQHGDIIDSIEFRGGRGDVAS